MCYSALVKRDLKTLEKRFGAVAVREQFDDYLDHSEQNPKRFPPLGSRIFPGNFAPVISLQNEVRTVLAMKYGLTPPNFIAEPKKYTSYNARLDNITSRFWSEAFLIGHGLIAIDAFYEWVEVRDLLSAGVVSLGQIQETFSIQAEERRQKLESHGKKYKPTATELKNARFRKIIIEFKPRNDVDMLAPVIFVQKKLEDFEEYSFAIVTHDPPPEIREAGHDRCPVFLTPESADLWIHTNRLDTNAALDVLRQRFEIKFIHDLPRAA